MKKHLTILLVLLYSFSFAQKISPEQLTEFARQIEEEQKGDDVGDGVILIGCRSFDRTLVYEYEVPKDWFPFMDSEENIIKNLKKTGNQKVFVQGQINSQYIYYRDDRIIEEITISPDDFLNEIEYEEKPKVKIDFGLADYISLKDLPKAKGVNMKIQPPKNWEVNDGNRPNIARIFSKDGRTYSILVKDNVSFFSRNEIKELLEDNEFTKDMIAGLSEAFKDPKVLKREIVTVDTYPTIEYMIKGNREQMGINMNLIIKGWVIFYEDKIISLQGATLSNEDSESYGLLYDQITNSVVFPDQYK